MEWQSILKVVFARHVNSAVAIGDPECVPDVGEVGESPVILRLRNDFVFAQPLPCRFSALFAVSVLHGRFVNCDAIHDDFRCMIGIPWPATKPPTANDDNGLRECLCGFHSISVGIRHC